MKKSPQYNQQTEPKQCKSEVEEICIYQNLESGCHSVIWKCNSGFYARKNPKQQSLSESSPVQWCFIQQKAHLC